MKELRMVYKLTDLALTSGNRASFFSAS